MEIIINSYLHKKIIEHCKRKLNRSYEKNETNEQQAFGIIIGRIKNYKYYATKVYCLKKNYRYEKNISKDLNNKIEKYAMPGELNINERAWAADPIEISKIIADLEYGERIIGTYHMHHDKSWIGNYPKYLPSDLDRELAKDTDLLMFITYIGEKKYSIRAFYEAKLDKEYNVKILGDE